MAVIRLVIAPIFRLLASIVVAAIGARLPMAAAEYAVFKSTDQGRSWGRSDAGLPGTSRLNAFIASNGVLFLGTDTGIYLSKDEARSWQPASGAYGPTTRVVALATAGSRVFVGTDHKGLFISPDGGATWIAERALPSEKVRCLLVSDSQVYVGTDAHGVYASNEFGGQWTSLAAGLPAHAQVFSLAAVRKTIFAALYRLGLYVWDSQNETWVKCSIVLPLTLAGVGDTLIAGHNPGGLFWSADFGIRWSKGTASGQALGSTDFSSASNSDELRSEAPVWELASNNKNVVFAGADAGVFYSNDFGRTWRRSRSGLPKRCPGVAFLLQEKFVLAGVQLPEGPGGPDRAGELK